MLAFAVACSEDGDDEPIIVPASTATASATAAATAAPTAVATAGATPRTGIAAVDAVIRAVAANDAAALAGLVQFVALPCGPQQGPGSPPACPAGAPDGTPVPVLGVSSCEGGVYTADQVRALLASTLQQGPVAFVGAYRLPPAALPPAVIVYAAPGREIARLPAAAEHLALFARTGPAGTRPGLAFAIAGDSVTGLYSACDVGFPPERLVPPGAQPLPAS